jgi:alkylation response protein AidB-like acyl-CoA dehydrogenase
VNFEPDDDERALQQGIRELCRGRAPLERLRSAEGGRLDRELWAELAEAGVFSLRAPEDAGGAGLGAAAAALVLEELGRALVPGPLVATMLAGARDPGAADGSRVVGAVERDEPAAVEHLVDLDDLVVADGDGLWSIDPKTLEHRVLEPPLDPLTAVGLVASLPPGARIGDAGDAERWRLEGAALTSALLVGLADGATAHAVEYARDRRQFDRVIGSFQSVKHLLADMLVRTELARSAAYAAAAMIDDTTTGDAPTAVAAAKVLAGEAALANGKGCVQVMGGMGFTWEMPAHLFLKRAVVVGTAFGTTERHAERLAESLTG